MKYENSYRWLISLTGLGTSFRDVGSGKDLGGSLFGASLIATTPVVGQALRHGIAEHRDPLTIWLDVLLATGAGLYVAGISRMPAHVRLRLGSATFICYFAGLAVIGGVLLPPFDGWSEELFAMHMVQHLALIMLAAPLIALGRPGLVCFWSFGTSARKTLAALPLAAKLRRLEVHAAWPITIWIIFCGVFIVWHAPGPHTLALQNSFLHACEHSSFLISSILFWRYALDPSGRLADRHGHRLVFVSTAAMLSGLPGALLVFATRSFYPAYAATAGEWGLSPLEDQQLAGLLMWIPGGLIYLAVISLLFWEWLEVSDRRANAAVSAGQSRRVSR